jgi:hypothetical protein
MTNPDQTFTLSITAAGLLAVLTCDTPAFAQDASSAAVAPEGPISPSLRYNVSNEWEMHRRSASPDYRPKYRSLFVDPGYSRYCPIQPYWNGVFSAGGSPRAGACCPLFSK